MTDVLTRVSYSQAILSRYISHTNLGKLILTEIYPGEADEPLHGLGQWGQAVLPQLEDPELGQSAEVGRDVLQEAVVEVELGEADELRAALGDFL